MQRAEAVSRETVDLEPRHMREGYGTRTHHDQPRPELDRGCGDGFSLAVGEEDPQQLPGWDAMDGLQGWVARKKFQFEAITSLSMLEPSEKRVLCILP